MFAKLFVILGLIAVALAKEYPPGVSPAVCPDYPNCDPVALATHTLDGTPIPEWFYNPSILPIPPVDVNNPIPRYAPGADPYFYAYPYARFYF